MEEKVIASFGAQPDGTRDKRAEAAKPAMVCTKPFDSENFRLCDDDAPCKNGEA